MFSRFDFIEEEDRVNELREEFGHDYARRQAKLEAIDKFLKHEMDLGRISDDIHEFLLWLAVQSI